MAQLSQANRNPRTIHVSGHTELWDGAQQDGIHTYKANQIIYLGNLVYLANSGGELKWSLLSPDEETFVHAVAVERQFMNANPSIDTPYEAGETVAVRWYGTGGVFYGRVYVEDPRVAGVALTPYDNGTLRFDNIIIGSGTAYQLLDDRPAGPETQQATLARVLVLPGGINITP